MLQIDFELRYPLEAGCRLYDYLMFFGDKAADKRPQFLRQRIIEKYEAVLEHYRGG